MFRAVIYVATSKALSTIFPVSVCSHVTIFSCFVIFYAIGRCRLLAIKTCSVAGKYRVRKLGKYAFQLLKGWFVTLLHDSHERWCNNLTSHFSPLKSVIQILTDNRLGAVVKRCGVACGATCEKSIINALQKGLPRRNRFSLTAKVVRVG